MGWQASTLGEVFDVRDGTHDSPKYQDEGYPLITSKNLKNGNLSFEKVNFISKVDFEKINTRSEVHKGDVLFAMIGTIGNPVLITEEPVFSIKNVALFKVPKTQSGKFLKYYLESSFVTEKMFKEAKGSTQKFVGLGYLRTFPISLPPIPEQQRIVAILDQAFADIEKARANAEKNLKNARELFDSYLNQVFSQRGEGWSTRTMSDERLLQMIDGDRGHNYPKKSEFDDEGYCLFLSTKNVRPNGFKFQDTVFISEERDNLLRKGRLARNDVVITTRGTIGNLALFDDSVEYNNIRINSGMLILRPNIGQILPSYLFEIMRSNIVKSQILAKTSGAAQPQLPIQTLNTFTFPVPESLDEQKEMVLKLRGLEKKGRMLQAVYINKIASLDELKKSLLQKAFSGELTKTSGQAA